MFDSHCPLHVEKTLIRKESASFFILWLHFWPHFGF
nr:MAG TPA: hypothetical protein [Caudoviricetes sp.]